MNARPKPKDISWLKFSAILIILYAVILLLYFTFKFLSDPAIAYDKKQKQNQANLK